jgi:ABC-2 type transport system ATP-binding protein
MTVTDQIVYLGQLHGLSRDDSRRRTAALLDRLDLTERGGDQVEKLSLGNQQRVQIAAALVHDPEVLVLDEPFSGLDPIAVETVVGVLRERAATGAPVLFSSHQLELVERLCDDLVIIADGTIRATGNRSELRASYALPRYAIEVGADAGWLRDQPGVTLVTLDGPRAVFDLADGVSSQDVLRAALARDAVTSFGPVQPTLAEIFREVVSG